MRMVTHIQETVSSTYISWTYDCDTVYEMLVALQKRLKPKKDVRRRELINKLIELRDNLSRKSDTTFSQGTIPELPTSHIGKGAALVALAAAFVYIYARIPQIAEMTLSFHATQPKGESD
jgi:hypothetical protein